MIQIIFNPAYLRRWDSSNDKPDSASDYPHLYMWTLWKAIPLKVATNETYAESLKQNQ